LLRAQAGGKFEMLANNKLAEDDVCVATPALAGDRLFIRTATRVNSSSRLATKSCSISAGHWLRVCRPSTFRTRQTQTGVVSARVRRFVLGPALVTLIRQIACVVFMVQWGQLSGRGGTKTVQGSGKRSIFSLIYEPAAALFGKRR
jgi:hypothetical protein